MQHSVFYLRLSKQILGIHSPSLQHCLGLLSLSCYSQENRSKEWQTQGHKRTMAGWGLKTQEASIFALSPWNLTTSIFLSFIISCLSQNIIKEPIPVNSILPRLINVKMFASLHSAQNHTQHKLNKQANTLSVTQRLPG